jgi:RNA polymerase sigma factor (sigma-70 family)
MGEMSADFPDRDLLRQYVRDHSEPAFRALVERHVDLVYGAAFRQLNNRATAEEVTQTVFIALAARAASLVGHPSLAGWLFHTAVNQARQQFRGEQRRRLREEAAAQLAKTMQANEPPALAGDLNEAMLQLRDDDREALVLRFYKQMPLDDVGAVLGVDGDAARKRVARAVDKLRQILARRGVAVSAVAVTAALSVTVGHAAPAGLAATVAGAATFKGTASTATLITGTLKLMAWTKLKTAIVIGAGILLAAGTATVVVKQVYPSEPVYQGKSLTYWLESLGPKMLLFHNLRPDANQPAAEAFQAMGVKTVPFLRRELHSRDLARWKHAADAARTIGPAAKVLIPDLLTAAVATADSGHDPYAELFALAAMGPESIGPLTTMFTNQNKWARINTTTAVYMTDYDAEAAVPALLKELDDPDAQVRSQAPAALAHIHKQLDVVLPALLKNLKDPDDSVRWCTASAIGQLGPDAKSAFPDLLEVWHNDKTGVASWAGGALKNIDPEAAAKAGVK